MRKEQQETLEIILYQHELKGIYKFQKEIKRIQYQVKELGQKCIEGIKFTLAINQPHSVFPQSPPVIFEKRYVHIFVDCCKNLPAMDNNKSSDPFVKISLNKHSDKDKERYVNRTRVILKELNPVFKQTFHIPLYSLRDDIIYIEVYDYDKLTKCDLIGKVEIKVSSLDYGIVNDDWFKVNNGTMHLITHLSDHNKPAFVSEPFFPFYLNVKLFELYNKDGIKKSATVKMKNDIFPFLNKVFTINPGKFIQYSNAIFTIPISNINDTYVIEKLAAGPSGLYVESNFEFPTQNLEEGLIYRYNNNDAKFWTQITRDKNITPFSGENFANYYNLTPEENYTLYIEIKRMNSLPISDIDESSDPYYIAKYGDQIFKSRVIENNLNPIFYDEFKFKVKKFRRKINY
jgi:hypothetical protein